MVPNSWWTAYATDVATAPSFAKKLFRSVPVETRIGVVATASAAAFRAFPRHSFAFARAFSAFAAALSFFFPESQTVA